MPEALEAGGNEAFNQYQEQWRGQRDPWGETWPGTQRGNSPILFDEGRLASPDVVFTANMVKIKPERYWVFHQIGANHMPRRAVLPFSKSLWDKPIEDRIREVVDGRLLKVAA